MRLHSPQLLKEGITQAHFRSHGLGVETGLVREVGKGAGVREVWHSSEGGWRSGIGGASGAGSRGGYRRGNRGGERGGLGLGSECGMARVNGRGRCGGGVRMGRNVGQGGGGGKNRGREPGECGLSGGSVSGGAGCQEVVRKGLIVAVWGGGSPAGLAHRVLLSTPSRSRVSSFC